MRLSSIFSSENLAALGRLPLRSYLWLACVGVTLAAVTFLSSTQLDRLSTRYKRPMPLYIESGEVMLLGDSTLLYLDTWDYPVRNFALPTCGYMTQEALFDALSPEMPRLQVLLLSLSILDYYKKDLVGRNGDYRDLVDWGVPWSKLPGITPAQRFDAFVHYNQITAPFLVGPKLDIRTFSRVSLIPLEFKPDDKTPRDFAAQADRAVAATAKTTPKASTSAATKVAGSSAPSRPLPVLTPSPSAGSSALSAQEAATLANYAGKLLKYAGEALADPPEHHKKGLFDMLAACRERGIQPVFVKVPSPGGLLRSAPITDERIDALYAEVNAAFADLAIPIWDAEKEQGIYGIDLFKDHLHLSEKGLAKFNQFLNEKLTALPLPGTNLPRMDSIRRTENLLIDASPADRPSPWARSPGVSAARVGVPSELRSAAKFATRLVLPPGTFITQLTESPILAGSTCTARVWIWAEKSIPSEGFKVILARHGDEPWEGAVAPLATLPAAPQEIALLATFSRRYNKVRLEIRNDSPRNVALYMAAPSINIQYTGGNAEDAADQR